MRHSRLSTLIASLILLAASGVFVVTLIRAAVYAPEEEARVQPVADEPEREEAPPARLVVPKLGIDANVQDVGVNTKGRMAAPNNFTDVGWYRYGAVPGDRGSAVVDGHVDNGLKLAGVFKRLSELSAGDELFIETASSTRIRFVVTEVVSYQKEDVPLDLIFNRADRPRLNLITCDGAWLSEGKTYDRRLVVYTVRVDE